MAVHSAAEGLCSTETRWGTAACVWCSVLLCDYDSQSFKRILIHHGFLLLNQFNMFRHTYTKISWPCLGEYQSCSVTKEHYKLKNHVFDVLMVQFWHNWVIQLKMLQKRGGTGGKDITQVPEMKLSPMPQETQFNTKWTEKRESHEGWRSACGEGQDDSSGS